MNYFSKSKRISFSEKQISSTKRFYKKILFVKKYSKFSKSSASKKTGFFVYTVTVKKSPGTWPKIKIISFITKYY